MTAPVIDIASNRNWGVSKKLRLNQHADLPKLQQGKCASCRTKAATHIDYCDPATGGIRGLLCADCDRIVRMFKDAETLTLVSTYLKARSKTNGKAKSKVKGEAKA
jgi:Recombination endonuclease VII